MRLAVDAVHGSHNPTPLSSRVAATHAMANTYTYLMYHIVFSTKERRALITSTLAPKLFKYIGGIIRDLDGSLLEINGTRDHVHLLLKLPPKLAVSDAMQVVKGNSSKWVNKQKSPLHRFAWQVGFAAFTVSRSQIERVRRYIEGQKKHHARRDFKSELLALLKKHEVEFDARYVFD